MTRPSKFARLIPLMASTTVFCACAAEEIVEPEICFIGDREAEPEVGLVTRSLVGQLSPMVEGTHFPLLHRPSIGQVALAGIRARNVSCTVLVTAALTDECTGRLVAVDHRPMRLVEGPDGYGIPEDPESPENFANLAVCPVEGLEHAADDALFALHLRVDAANGYSARVSARVIPSCADPSDRESCQCDCAANWELGMSCQPRTIQTAAQGEVCTHGPN